MNPRAPAAGRPPGLVFRHRSYDDAAGGAERFVKDRARTRPGSRNDVRADAWKERLSEVRSVNVHVTHRDRSETPTSPCRQTRIVPFLP